MLMKEKGITQLEVSQLSDIPKSTISDYVNERTLISVKNLERLASILKVEIGIIDPSFEKGSKN